MELNQFKKAIEAIREQMKLDDNMDKHLSEVFTEASGLLYVESPAMEGLLDLLKDLCNDKNNWIRYYVFEIDFGKTAEVIENGNEIPLKTVEDLYNLIFNKMEQGIEKIKNALSVVIETAEKVDQALADDGKISLFEGVGIAIKAVKFIGVVKDAEELQTEFMDMDDDEKQELINYVADELELTNEETEEKIEAIFSALITLAVEIF